MPYEVPVFNLGNPIWIRAIADEGTPAELAPYSNRYLAIREEADLPPVGTRGIVVVNGVSVPGYLRNKDGEWQWVITAQQDPMEPLVIGLPGANGWVNQQAGMVWYNIGMSLRGAGISGPDIAYGFAQLFNAARTEILAEQAQQSAAKGSTTKAVSS